MHDAWRFALHCGCWCTHRAFCRCALWLLGYSPCILPHTMHSASHHAFCLTPCILPHTMHSASHTLNTPLQASSQSPPRHQRFGKSQPPHCWRRRATSSLLAYHTGEPPYHPPPHTHTHTQTLDVYEYGQCTQVLQLCSATHAINGHHTPSVLVRWQASRRPKRDGAYLWWAQHHGQHLHAHGPVLFSR
jgi:hypothetical protein